MRRHDLRTGNAVVNVVHRTRTGEDRRFVACSFMMIQVMVMMMSLLRVVIVADTFVDAVLR